MIELRYFDSPTICQGKSKLTTSCCDLRRDRTVLFCFQNRVIRDLLPEPSNHKCEMCKFRGGWTLDHTVRSLARKKIDARAKLSRPPTAHDVPWTGTGPCPGNRNTASLEYRGQRSPYQHTRHASDSA